MIVPLKHVRPLSVDWHSELRPGFPLLTTEPVPLKAGDLAFCHGGGIVDWGIRAAEWLRFRKGSRYNHVAVLNAPLGDGDWSVIEAESPGVIMSTLSSLTAHGEVKIVSVPVVCNRQDVVQFMRFQLGEKYGFLTIASLLVSLILPGSVNFYKPGTWICSAVAAEALRYGGWFHQWDNIYQVSPAQLYQVLVEEQGNKVRTIEKVNVLSN
jgi:hypothetical protein